MAFHLRTNGQTERMNAWIEQYLRPWTSQRQNNWAKLLPVAEFAHNSWKSDTMRKSPHKLLIGIKPQVNVKLIDENVPAALEWLQLLEEFRKEVQTWLEQLQKGKDVKVPTEMKVEDKVWLEGKNLSVTGLWKLLPQWYGPFTIKQRIGQVAYKLELPSHMKIHDVFHIDLLMPYSIRRWRPTAHLIHDPHQWSKKVKKSTKLNQSSIVGDMEEEENNNISYTGRDIPTPTTYGSTMRTYMHQNFLKNTSHILLWLDNQMFKRGHSNIDSFPIPSFNTTTMSFAYSSTASVYDYPSHAISPWNAFQEDHQLPPILMSPPPICIITPFPDQTMSHSPPPAIHYPEWLSTPELIAKACCQERRSQSAAHAALITQTSQLMGWHLMDAIQVFCPRSPNRGTTPPPPRPNRPSLISNEEEEMLVNNIVDSPTPIPIHLCPIDLVPYSPTPSLQHDLHLINALEHGEAMSAPLQEYPQQYQPDTPIPTIIPQPVTPLSPHLEHDVQVMEALVAEEFVMGANPQQAHDLLVRIIHKTMLQPGQEVLRSAADKEQTPPAPPVYTWPPSYAPQSPASEPDIRPTPYAHPGPNWVVNLTNEGITHDERIPTDKHSEEEEITPFYSYDFATDSPELLLTRGCNHQVHSCPLYARARPYNVPLFIHRERLLFYHGQPYTPLVDAALDQEWDVTLWAKAHHFWRTISQVEDQAAHLVLIRQQFNETWHSAQQSLNCLARADAFNQLIQPVLQTTSEADILPRIIIEEGLVTWTNPEIVEPQWAYDQCDWCHCQTHPTHQCHIILHCLLCWNNGHPKSACPNPHHFCQIREGCHIPHNHPRSRSRNCPAL